MKKCNFRMSQFVVHIKTKNEPLSLKVSLKKWYCWKGKILDFERLEYEPHLFLAMEWIWFTKNVHLWKRDHLWFTLKTLNWHMMENMEKEIKYIRRRRIVFTTWWKYLPGLEILFFEHLPFGQVLPKNYLPETSITCPVRASTMNKSTCPKVYSYIQIGIIFTSKCAYST